MTSAEREARDEAFSSVPRKATSAHAFKAGWAARAEYARGATVAEIVEWLRDRAHWPAATADEEEAIDLLIDQCEAQFSPAPPRDYNDTRPSNAKEPQ